MSADGETRRSLAVLEHKPWHPSDGETWVAAFPWAGEDVEIVDAELAVAPDIAVSLPALGSSKRVARSSGKGREGTGTASNGASAAPKPSARSDASKRSGPTRRSSANAELIKLRDEREELGRALEKQRTETQRLHAELADAQAAKLEGNSALARRDALLAKLEQVTTERDEALASREALRRSQRDAIQAEVEERLAGLRAEIERERQAAGRMTQALRERDAARAACDAAVTARDIAGEQRAAAVRERNELLAQRDRARTEAGDLSQQLEFALARAERNTAERDSANAERDRLARDLDAALSAAGRNRAAIARARGVITGGRRDERGTDWFLRARALSPLLVFVIVVIVLVRTT